MPYAELHASSAFSFLEGASLPEDLVVRAAELKYSAVALVDRDGVYGAPRFYQAAKGLGIRALVGAEVSLQDQENLLPTHHSRASRVYRRWPKDIVHGSCRTSSRPKPHASNPGAARDGVKPAPRLTLLVASQTGYRNLCRLITAGALGRPKGKNSVTLDEVGSHAEGLYCLTGGEEGLLSRILDEKNLIGARETLSRLRDIFPNRLYVELQRHRQRRQEFRNHYLVQLASEMSLPLVATNGVRYARPKDKDLFDVLTCIRLNTTVDQAGARLAVNRERHLKSESQMKELFSHLPEALQNAAALTGKLDFTLENLGYRFPDYPLPPGEPVDAFLRRITFEGARQRFRPLTAEAAAQLEKELALIEKLGLAGYFLIVWDIIQFCKREKILVQGRGSAANSAVCYALSITAIDPLKMKLLFERFLSENRGEWPDIDLDLPSGDQREKVIQYVYTRYGRQSAAMTANVINYRPRSALRDVGKALGYSVDQLEKVAHRVGHLAWGELSDKATVSRETTAAGLNPNKTRVKQLLRLWARIQNLPRHLGQHSGGMVIAAGRLDEIVPLEPATMPGRVVVQWDKEDCADLGIIKVDLLGLGMLDVMEKALPMIEKAEGVKVDLAHLPPDDPKVYAMLQKADTIGVFQVESRAQMASLPRNAPKCFYDIVVQVAIIRPGPIVGGMIKPFFERRHGAKIEYAHPCLKPILERTLGVPLFQEQIIRMGMVAAGFSGGEAEELRRAMGFKRSTERMSSIEDRLRKGMTTQGVPPKAQEEIVKMITSFAVYGFPESHAASFALLAYASAYLKAHHPAAFYASLLNAWPMGFYHPATLVKDAQRHNVEVLPIDVTYSDWDCTRTLDHPVPLLRKEGTSSLFHSESNAVPSSAIAGRQSPLGQNSAPGALRRVEGVGEGKFLGPLRHSRESGNPGGAGDAIEKSLNSQTFRLGLRFIRGLHESVGKRIVAERAARPFTSAADMAARCSLSGWELELLAHAGALSSFDLSRRAALWQVSALGRPLGPLFDGKQADGLSPLKNMTAKEETVADLKSAGLTTGPHLLHHMRDRLKKDGILSAEDLMRAQDGILVRTAGAVIVRQHPQTAKGFVFLTLEDETGMSQAIINPTLYKMNRPLIHTAAALVVEGILQKQDGALSLKAKRFWPINAPSLPRSHDFH